MSDALAIAAVLLVGATLWRAAARYQAALPALPGAVAGGTLAVTAWLSMLQLAGIRWSPVALAVPVVAAAGLLLLAPRPPAAERSGSERGWAWAAGLAATPAALLASGGRVGGWDFRYVWGLKAEAFAQAGAHDAAWLAWPGHVFAHPDYPPLWPDLLAVSPLLGGDVTRAALLWQGILVAALAVACWWAADPARPWVRALAAVVGAWAPVLLLPAYAGYAEPLLALLAVIALGALRRHGPEAPGGAWVLAGAIAALGLAKNEGTALAVGVALAGVRAARGRDRLVVAAGLLPVVAWQAFRLANGVPGESLRLSPALVAGRLAELPLALMRTLRIDTAVLLVIWVLALVALRGRELGGVRLALAVWGLAVLATYTAGAPELAWRLDSSLDRVLVGPLPATVALALAAAPSLRGGARPEPGSGRGAAPSA